MGGSRALLPLASITLGVLGAACIPIVFPDLTAVFAVLAVAAGAAGWVRARSGSARVLSAGGTLVGVALLVAVAVSVRTGGATRGGGGPAGRAAGGHDAQTWAPDGRSARR